MINLVCWLSTHDIEDLHSLGVRWVDNSEDIGGKRNVSLVQEFNSEALVLWRGDEFALIRVYIEVLTGIDKGKVLSSLND